MALINCLECKKEVSDKAIVYTNCGFKLRKVKRLFLGKQVKCSFIIFNICMAIYLFSIYDRAGLVLGNGSHMSLFARIYVENMISNTIFTWVAGDLILGLFLYFTKPKS
ncbi:hypothetical protein [Haemophilus parahaemolyticus]